MNELDSLWQKRLNDYAYMCDSGGDEGECVCGKEPHEHGSQDVKPRRQQISVRKTVANRLWYCMIELQYEMWSLSECK